MGTVLKVEAKVGMMSMIGTSDEYPLRWGNYFCFRKPEIRVLNFWAENLQELVERKILDDGMVQIRLYEWDVAGTKAQACIIDDPRIPAEWYYNNLCFTGSRKPSVEIAQEIYGYLGDPNNELEQFTDSEMYHARRGGVVDEKGFVSYKVGPDRPSPEDLVAALLKKRA